MQHYTFERDIKKKTELTGRSPLMRQRSALDCNATEEKEQ